MNRVIRRAHPQSLWAGLLLVLLIAVLFLEGFPVIHAHLDGEPGFYNAACSLSLLAAPTGGATLPILALPGSRLPELPATIETAEASPPSPLVPGSAPRAPPVV